MEGVSPRKVERVDLVRWMGRCFTPQEAPAHTIIDRLSKTSSFSSSSLLSPHCDHHFMRPMMICTPGITCQLNHQILEALFHGTGSTRTHTGYYWSIEQHIILLFFIITISHIVSLSGQGKFCSYPHSISKSSWLVRNCFVGNSIYTILSCQHLFLTAGHASSLLHCHRFPLCMFYVASARYTGRSCKKKVPKGCSRS